MGSFVRQRMQIAHQALQSLLDDMGIDLCRGDVGVAKQRLDDSQIGSIVQKMTCKGVAQHMRTDEARRDAGGRCKLLEVACEVLPRQMAALARRWKQPLRDRGRFLLLDEKAPWRRLFSAPPAPS